MCWTPLGANVAEMIKHTNATTMTSGMVRSQIPRTPMRVLSMRYIIAGIRSATIQTPPVALFPAPWRLTCEANPSSSDRSSTLTLSSSMATSAGVGAPPGWLESVQTLPGSWEVCSAARRPRSQLSEATDERRTAPCLTLPGRDDDPAGVGRDGSWPSRRSAFVPTAGACLRGRSAQPIRPLGRDV